MSFHVRPLHDCRGSDFCPSLTLRALVVIVMISTRPGIALHFIPGSFLSPQITTPWNHPALTLGAGEDRIDNLAVDQKYCPQNEILPVFGNLINRKKVEDRKGKIGGGRGKVRRSRRGHQAYQEIAETTVILDRPARHKIDGKQKQYPGEAITLRFVVTHVRGATTEFKDLLVKLSGKTVKRTRPHTCGALLTGLFVLLRIFAFWEQVDFDPGKIAKNQNQLKLFLLFLRE